MGRSLSADDVEEILETYAETHSVTETVEKTDFSEKTVRKYRDEAIENNDTRMPEVPSDAGDGEGAQVGDVDPGDSPFGPEDETRVIDDYSGMTPGDFIIEFFNEFEVGIKDQWVKIQARRADRRQKLPTKESLKKDLLGMKSGVSNSALKEGEYIATEYWAEAQNFLRATSYEAEMEPLADQQMQGQMGMGAQGMQQGGFGQEFVGPGGQQMGMGGQAGPQNMMQMLMQRLQQLEQKIDRSGQASGGGGRDTETLQTLEELKREKEILEELSSGDERLQQIEQRISQLQQQAMQDSGGGQPLPPSADGSIEDQLLQMAASREDVSLSEVLELIEKREGTHKPPEVLEAEAEKEVKLAELKSERERTEKLAETAEGLVERFGEAVGERIVGGGSGEVGPSTGAGQSQASADGGTESASASPNVTEADVAMANAPQQPQQQADAEPEVCPHCETELNQHMGGVTCPNCQYGIGSCDLCSFPVEIPPLGEADYAICGGCESILEKPDDDSEIVECDNCGWEGQGSELMGEGIKCDNCENLRPLKRQPDPEEAQKRVNELLES